MNKLRVHILYEHGADLRPHGGSYLRLLRPLTHPSIQDQIQVTFSRHLPLNHVDVIILDRLWRSFEKSMNIARELIKKINGIGTKIIYAFDDNFEIWVRDRYPYNSSYADIFHYFIDNSDGLLVTSQKLSDEFSKRKSNVVIIPNMLDERLLVPVKKNYRHTDLIRIGYMGTPTHDNDLQILIPVIQELHQKYKDRLSFEIVGILDVKDLAKLSQWKDVSIKIISPRPSEIEYPLFMLWFTQFIDWDIALAPLENTPFNLYKSDVKLLDYASIGAAGVFSHCEAYKRTVNNNVNGCLVENQTKNWVDSIQSLIEDREKRTIIQQNAQKYLFSERILAKTANLWVEGIYKLINY